ncbi:hypothetical protein [Micromonospora sp. NPDC005305]|uniref:hypothetical protein n=1 Tax=Micromonospora sp. NPDC005305 TaxID=3156875 RepID=UPI00339FB2E2
MAARPAGLAAPVKLAVIFVGALLTGLLGELLRGMVVTFPYSGVLVAVEARRQLAEFSRHFARNSLALVGFLAGHHYLQDTSPVLALAAGWAAFALVAGALHLPRVSALLRIEWPMSRLTSGRASHGRILLRKPQQNG